MDWKLKVLELFSLARFFCHNDWGKMKWNGVFVDEVKKKKTTVRPRGGGGKGAHSHRS